MLVYSREWITCLIFFHSMHDSRWEEDEEEEVDEKEKTLPVEEKEKETCVEKTVKILVALQNLFFLLLF